MPATYNDIKDEIARVASGAGFVTNDERLKTRVHSIQTRLGYGGNWVGVLEQVEFAAYDRVVSLPLRYESIQGVAVNDQPTHVMPDWYEFLEYGPGPQDDNNWVKTMIRRGNSPVVRQSYDEARYIRAYAFEDERDSAGVIPTIRVLGYDENDLWVRSLDGDGEWQDGIDMELPGHSATNYSISSVKLKRVVRVEKPATVGRVELWWSDNTTPDTLYFAGRYDYFETKPSYAQYVVPILGTDVNTHVIKALCRRKIRPIVTGDEELLFDNVEAFRLGLIAMKREETEGQLQEGVAFWQLALQTLVDQHVSIHGRSNAQPILNVVGDSNTTGAQYEVM